jgi:c-di-GMP-binding flagellar brake protein YcgR
MTMTLPATPEGDIKVLTRFLVHARTEILAVARELAARHALVNLYYSGAHGCCVTSILAVDPAAGQMVIDAPRTDKDTEAIVRSQRLTAVAFLDRVKVQFGVAGAVRIVFKGGPALRMPLPDEVLRLQRRDYFRVPTPQTRPLSLMVPRDAEPAKALPLRVIDISCGGVGVLLPQTDLAFKPGQVLRDCWLELPDYGKVGGSLAIRWIRNGTSPAGKPESRCGIQFLDLTPSMLAQLQLFIHRLERHRLSRG